MVGFIEMKIDTKRFFHLLFDNFCKDGCTYYNSEARPSESEIKEYEENPDTAIESLCKIETFDKCPIFYLTGVDWLDVEF